MEAFEPQAENFKLFLVEFSKDKCNHIGSDDALPHRIVSNFITEDELEAEILDWVFSHLSVHKAPNLLACLLARETLNHALQWDIKKDYVINPVPTSSQQTGDEDDDDKTEILENEVLSDKTPLLDVSKLARDVYNTLHVIIKIWAREEPTCFKTLPQGAPYCGISVNSIRNGRRKMEDKHVVLPYLSQLYPQLQGDDAKQCFVAVYDGHAGTEAARYASAHLHDHVVKHPAFNCDPITAMEHAYKVIDTNFISKCKRECMRSGSTAVTALLRDNKLYISWLGDSQMLLVKNGRPVEVMLPHKPEREDERQRIEEAGGFVVMLGTWRVNATLSVSRAIGDPEFKPIVSGVPDLATVDLTGDEDYVILACDGLWDTLSYDDVVKESYNYLNLSSGSKANLAAYLSQRAKEKGSTDNISVIVVFLRDEISKPRLEEMVAPLVAEEDDQVAGSQGGGDSDSSGAGSQHTSPQHGASNTQDGHSNSPGAKQSQQQDSDLFNNQSHSGLQSQINIPLSQLGNVLQRLEYKSCQSRKTSHVHIIEGNRVVEYNYYPKEIVSKAADERQIKITETIPPPSPVIPEHFVKAFHYARKFPAQNKKLSEISKDYSNTPSPKSVTFASENQENQSPNLSTPTESHKKSGSTRPAQKIYLESENCSDASNSELKLITETGKNCVYVRKSKGKRSNRNKLKAEDARRASRDKLSLGIAERTKLSSNSSSSSPHSLIGAKKSNINSSKKNYGRNVGKEDAHMGFSYGETSPTCKSNWTVAVEIENAAGMFGE